MAGDARRRERNDRLGLQWPRVVRGGFGRRYRNCPWWRRLDHCGRARDSHVARRRHGAHDIGFDDDVAWPADHHQVLDIVAPHQNEAAASVDAGVVDHRQTRLAAPRADSAKPASAKPPDQPSGDADQPQHNDEGEKELHRKGHTPEQRHLTPRCGGPSNKPSGSPLGRQWLTTPETFAAANTNKELTAVGLFTRKCRETRIVMVNGGLMAGGPMEPALTRH